MGVFPPTRADLVAPGKGLVMELLIYVSVTVAISWPFVGGEAAEEERKRKTAAAAEYEFRLYLFSLNANFLQHSGVCETDT